MSEQGPMQGRSAQRRRLALLALLAVTRRTLSRDKVIACLWPERDADSARRLLSESLYVLRKSLGEDALLSPGDDLQLNGNVVWTDVAAFEDAMAAGDHARAVELYAGPFLDGFFISDAAEFEQWVDTVRDRYARSRMEALESLAARAMASGDGREAVGWWRRLAAADPYSARIALGLMRALEATGDRAGALQHARIHATLLEREFEAEPDPDVEAFAARLRAEPGPTPAGRAIREIPVAAGPPGPADPAAGDDSSTVAPAAQGEAVPAPMASLQPDAAEPSRRLRPAPALLLLLLVLLASWLTWILTRGTSTGAGDAPAASAAPPLVTVLAVFPCEAHGESSAAGADGIDILVGDALDRAGVRTVDTRTRLTGAGIPIAAGGDTPSDPAPLAVRFGANAFVTCRVQASGGKLRITAILQTVSGSEPRRFTADGTNVIDTADSLAILLAPSLIDDPAIDRDRLKRGMTRSPAAFGAFVRGSSLYLAGRYDDAAVPLVEAVGLDSTFALAWYRLSAAREFGFRFPEARIAIEHANAHAARLTESDRNLVRAWDAFLAGRAGDAERRYEAILAQEADDPDALSGLAEVLAHYNAVRGRSPREAKARLESVLESAPDYGEARFHLMELASMEGDSSTFHRLQSGVDPSSFHAIVWQAVDAFRWGSAADRELMRRRLEHEDGTAVMFAVGRIAAHLLDFANAERACDALLGPGRTQTWRAAGWLMRAELAVARGRFSGVAPALAQVAPVEPSWSLELGTLIALLDDAGTDRETLLALRDSVEVWNPTERDPNLEAFPFQTHADVHPLLRQYLLGLLHAALHEDDEAYRMASAVSARTLPTREFAQQLGGSIRARVMLGLHHDTTGAIRLLRPSSVQAPVEKIIASPFFSRALDRLLVADLLVGTNQLQSADSIYLSLMEGYDAMFVAPALFKRARIRERLGDNAGAASFYRQFATLWDSADARLQPRVAEARARARRLEGGPGS